MIQLGIPFIPYEEIEARVREFVAQYPHRDQIPFPIEELIEFDLGIDIVTTPNLQKVYDIEGFTSSDTTAIYVDEYVYKNRYYRYRFTLAHELGHIVLHSEIFKQYIFDSVLSWKEFVNQVNGKDYDSLEFQGYAFGGLILVPTLHLKKFFYDNLIEVSKLIDQAKSKGIQRSKYIDYAKDHMASILAPIFDVSTDVVVRRIEKSQLENQFP
ncbi:MAG: ImmA/IrrE family metallo-endopeptidase [Desulfobacterales bacterium]|nr:ImmA/IrrE family metallo-endopeptidase [Desulfobacterales bacterium]